MQREVKKSYVVAGDIYTAAVCKNKKSKKREVKNLEEQSQGWLSKPKIAIHCVIIITPDFLVSARKRYVLFLLIKITLFWSFTLKASSLQEQNARFFLSN